MAIFFVNPVNLIQTMTMALDLAVDGVSLHQKRTAIICCHLAEKLKMSSTDEQSLLSAALMHDIGAASSYEERKRLADSRNTEWGEKESIYSHAENGYDLLKSSRSFDHLAEIVRCHHDAWDGGNPSGLCKSSIPLAARIIHLADRIEINTKKSGPMLYNCEPVRKIIKDYSGTQFDPSLVDVFFDCSKKESFWLDLTLPDKSSTLNARLNMGSAHFTTEDLLNVAELFATIIDRMSRFTATHSRSVSGVAVFLAGYCGFSKNELYMMRIAGLLHDLGKLSIPNAVLEKPGSLTAQEQLIVRQHTYYTYRILEQIEHLNQVAEWAAWHHETLDGAGYPFRLDEDSLTLGARIMAVADIFVALTENRPYRKKLPKETIMRIMKTMVENNKISGRLVELLFDHFQEAGMVVQTMEDWAGEHRDSY
ncbi:MAG: HD domain-containing protein [Deltaproteobacteria bacterium]|jgi:putative nucleotidyltransferase with HDIG domain|nr:HD domain-containing protein [Deltaproteobacteria bacterium]